MPINGVQNSWSVLSVYALNNLTIFWMHTYTIDLETRPLANCDPTNLHSRVLACGKHGLENITCFKPAEALGSHSVPGRETILICPTHLVIALSRSHNPERFYPAYL